MGLSRPAPISVMDREDVLDANMQSGFTIPISSLKVSFLIFMFSGATSTIKSQSVQISLRPQVTFAITASAFSCVIFSFFTRKSMFFRILALPPSANFISMSQRHTSYPSVIANACAIPAPIVPAPIIPTFISISSC